MLLYIHGQEFIKIRWWVENMNIENLSYEELKKFANELLEENKKLKMENDIYKFDYRILENAYLEYETPENTNI